MSDLQKCNTGFTINSLSQPEDKNISRRIDNIVRITSWRQVFHYLSSKFDRTSHNFATFTSSKTNLSHNLAISFN